MCSATVPLSPASRLGDITASSQRAVPARGGACALRHSRSDGDGGSGGGGGFVGEEPALCHAGLWVGVCVGGRTAGTETDEAEAGAGAEAATAAKAEAVALALAVAAAAGAEETCLELGVTGGTFGATTNSG